MAQTGCAECDECLEKTEHRHRLLASPFLPPLFFLFKSHSPPFCSSSLLIGPTTPPKIPSPSPEPSESRTPCCVRQTEECWECPSLNPAVLLCSRSPGPPPPHRSGPGSLAGLENRKHMHGFLAEGRVSEEALDLSPVIQPSVAV